MGPTPYSLSSSTPNPFDPTFSSLLTQQSAPRTASPNPINSPGPTGTSSPGAQPGTSAAQWRQQLAAVFPADQVNKMLYVIQNESGGNPNAVGDSGHSYGLFQSQSPRQSVMTPAQQIQDAYNRWKARGYADWGENNSYQGHRFGSLGNHPYPGG